jgi:hypothetical protein
LRQGHLLSRIPPTPSLLQYWKQISAFFQTTPGTIAFFLLLYISVQTGLFYFVVRFFFLFIWLSPLLLAPLASYLAKKVLCKFVCGVAGWEYICV